MVMELTPERAADFQTACAYERVFGSEILALLRVYGLDDGRVCFYLEEQEGSPAAAIALQDRALWVSARPGTGVDGLTALARSIDGLLEVNGDLATAQALQPILGGEIDSSVYMVYQGEMPPADPAVRLGTLKEVFDLRPGRIIDALALRRPIYAPLAVYGHYGRPELDLPWERTDRRAALLASVVKQGYPL